MTEDHHRQNTKIRKDYFLKILAALLKMPNPRVLDSPLCMRLEFVSYDTCTESNRIIKHLVVCDGLCYSHHVAPSALTDAGPTLQSSLGQDLEATPTCSKAVLNWGLSLTAAGAPLRLMKAARMSLAGSSVSGRTNLACRGRKYSMALLQNNGRLDQVDTNACHHHLRLEDLHNSCEGVLEAQLSRHG